MTQQIMVIDDASGVRLLLRDALKAAGYDVCLAADGKQALRLFHVQPTALVITDIFMPESDGIEVIRELRRLHPELPIIAISGQAEMPSHRMLTVAKALGANVALAKPFRMRELVEAVKTLLPVVAA